MTSSESNPNHRTVRPTLVRMKAGLPLSSFLVMLVLARVNAFTGRIQSTLRTLPVVVNSSTRRYNFFKEIIGKAFENDGNLSSDKGKGQYDAPGEEFIDSRPAEVLTETQRRWRQGQVGNVVSPMMLSGSKYFVDLFLAGVPERDPSNDLYGSKVNISSRDRETGLSLPSTPSISIMIEFLENGVCKASPSEFTAGKQDGQWKLSDDGKTLRFSIDTLGYTRVVETKGSIQNVFWTDEKEKSVRTKTSYSIPPGFVYGDIDVTVGRLPGSVNFGGSGVLRVEQSSGLFGVSSKLVSCGKFAMGSPSKD